MAREPTAPEIHTGASNLLISYDNYCVTGNADALTAEGFGLIDMTRRAICSAGRPSSSTACPGCRCRRSRYSALRCSPVTATSICSVFARPDPLPPDAAAAACSWSGPWPSRPTGRTHSLPVLDRRRVVAGRGRRPYADPRRPPVRDLGRRLHRRRPRSGHGRADEPGGWLPGLAGQVAWPARGGGSSPVRCRAARAPSAARRACAVRSSAIPNSAPGASCSSRISTRAMTTWMCPPIPGYRAAAPTRRAADVGDSMALGSGAGYATEE